MRRDDGFLSGHKTKNKWKGKSPTPGKTMKGWENGGGDCVISKEAKLLFNFSMLLWDNIEFQCGCRLANGPLSEQAAYWQRMVKGMGRRDPHLREAWRKPVTQLLLGAAFTFGCLDFDAGWVALVNVAVYAISSVGKNMSDSLCPTPVLKSDPKEFTFRTWSHHLFFS